MQVQWDKYGQTGTPSVRELARQGDLPGLSGYLGSEDSGALCDSVGRMLGERLTCLFIGGPESVGLNRWARQGSNLRPRDYESPALTAELRALPGTDFLHVQRLACVASSDATPEETVTRTVGYLTSHEAPPPGLEDQSYRTMPRLG